MTLWTPLPPPLPWPAVKNPSSLAAFDDSHHHSTHGGAPRSHEPITTVKVERRWEEIIDSRSVILDVIHNGLCSFASSGAANLLSAFFNPGHPCRVHWCRAGPRGKHLKTESVFLSHWFCSHYQRNIISNLTTETWKNNKCVKYNQFDG